MNKYMEEFKEMIFKFQGNYPKHGRMLYIKLNELEELVAFTKKVCEKAEMYDKRVQPALNLAWSYGQIDGAHHKLWVIDQMVRALCGSKEEYNKWVEAYQTPDGEDYWEWDTGIAP